MAYEQLKLENQLCFPVYAASRLIIREYQPYLDKLGITYPQYLVLLVLWEEENLSVNQIAEKLILNTNTITPLLKRMEQQDLIHREKSELDARKVYIKLTKRGVELEEEASLIPKELVKLLMEDNMEMSDLVQLRDSLNRVIESLSK